MTVAALSPSISYIETGAALPVAVPFRFKSGGLAVSRVLPSGAVVQLAAGVDYSVTGGTTDAGGTLTPVTSTSGSTLRIKRATPRVQAMDYTTGDRFPAESHELAIDTAMLIDQEQDVSIAAVTARALLVPDGEAGYTLPSLIARTSKIRLLGHGTDGAIGMLDPSQLAKGDPGGNAMAIGLFTAASVLTIPVGTDLVMTSGYGTVGLGVARYSYDAAVDAAYVVANPRTAFRSANSRGFRLAEAAPNVFQFGAVGDGATNDSPAVTAMVAAMPATGGIIEIPRAVYVFDSKVNDGGKPIVFRLATGARIVGPPGDWAIETTASGSGVLCESATEANFTLRPPASALVPATATATLGSGGTAGQVASVAVSTAGSGYKSQPMLWTTRSPTRKDAGLIATVNYGSGQMTAISVQAPGADYAAAPAVRMRGGGHGAIYNNGARRTRYENVTVDMASIPNACGIAVRGGWYVNIENCGSLYGSEHDTAIGLSVESWTQGVPGVGGSYGGAYVNRFLYPRFRRILMLGHDSSTITTTLILQPEALYIALHACVYIDIVAPVLQPLGLAAPSDDAREALFDLINVDVINITGGDFETPNRPATGGTGIGIMFRASGSCRDVRILGVGTNAFAGTIEDDRLSVGSEIKLSDPTRQARALRIGMADEYRQPDWLNIQRSGFYWAGSSFVVSSSNMDVRDIGGGTLRGYLDNIAAPGQALVMDVSRQLYLLTATAGAGARTLTQAFQFDAGGLSLATGTTVKIDGNQVLGARQAAITAPSGGGMIDAQARTAIGSILTALATHGLTG